MKTKRKLTEPEERGLPYHDLAMRFAAAYISVEMGHASVDYTYKRYIEHAPDLGEWWYALAVLATQCAGKRMSGMLEDAEQKAKAAKVTTQ